LSLLIVKFVSHNCSSHLLVLVIAYRNVQCGVVSGVVLSPLIKSVHVYLRLLRHTYTTLSVTGAVPKVSTR